MAVSLRDPIATFFAVSNGADPARLAQCFTADAAVYDEGAAHRGHAAIEAWLRAARAKFAYRVEPLDMAADAGRTTVTAHVIGDFPGSPIRLDHVFELDGDRIRCLRIG